MTISLVPEDTRLRRFECTGGETVFAVTFPVFAAGDVQVMRLRAGVTVTLTNPGDYTLSGVGNPSGFTVTLTAAAQAGDLIVVVSAQPVARSSQWTDGQALRAQALNAEFARWWIAAQQIARDVGRGLRLPLTDGIVALELPAKAVRANRVLGFDANGNPVAIEPNAQGLAVTPFAETLLSAADATAARGLLGTEAAGDARYARTGISNTFAAPQQVAQQLAVSRADSVIEGGRVILHRASDNVTAYQIQAFGGGASPVLRIVRLFGTPAQIAAFDENGRLTIADPTTAQHAATKGYADGLDTATRAYADAQITALNAARVVASADVTGATAQVDLPIPAGFGMFMLLVGDLRPSANSTLRLRTSADGTTFASGGADYYDGGSFFEHITLSSNIAASDTRTITGMWTIYPGGATTSRFSIGGVLRFSEFGTTFSYEANGGRAAVGRQQAIRLYLSTGTINRGTFRLIGVP